MQGFAARRPPQTTGFSSPAGVPIEAAGPLMRSLMSAPSVLIALWIVPSDWEA